MRLSRRDERLWIGAWLAFCALAVGALVWGVLLGRADALVESADDHWIERLDACEALVDAGDFERAAGALDRLEKQFPAKFIRHKFDRERERLYELLGRANAALGRKAKALETYTELTEYDPRNWRNWELLAQANGSFGELEAASAAYDHLLTLHPNHLPTVTHQILADARAGRCAEAVTRYESYLDAFLLATLTLELAETELRLQLPADGRAHEFELPVELASQPARLGLRLSGWSAAIGPLTFSGPLTVGKATARTRLLVTPAWEAHAAEAVGGAWSAASTEARLEAALAPGSLPAPTTLASFEVTAHKAVGAELWRIVEECYRTLGSPERLARARARTVVGGCPEAGTFFEE